MAEVINFPSPGFNNFLGIHSSLLDVTYVRINHFNRLIKIIDAFTVTSDYQNTNSDTYLKVAFYAYDGPIRRVNRQ